MIENNKIRDIFASSIILNDWRGVDASTTDCSKDVTIKNNTVTSGHLFLDGSYRPAIIIEHYVDGTVHVTPKPESFWDRPGSALCN